MNEPARRCEEQIISLLGGQAFTEPICTVAIKREEKSSKEQED